MSGRGGQGENIRVKPELQEECIKNGEQIADAFSSISVAYLDSLKGDSELNFLRGLGSSQYKILTLAEMIKIRRTEI